MFDKDVGVNWHLRFRLKTRRSYKNENEYLKYEKQITNKIK
jgi:hypothetical protein